MSGASSSFAAFVSRNDAGGSRPLLSHYSLPAPPRSDRKSRLSGTHGVCFVSGARSGPARSPRPRSAAERAFLGLGEPAERFLIAAVAAGTPRLGSQITEILGLEAAFGRDLVVGAIERAHRFARYGATDVRAILAAGSGVAQIVPAGVPLTLELPTASGRPLSAYAPARRP